MTRMITKCNPFQICSTRYKVFEILKDGVARDIDVIRRLIGRSFTMGNFGRENRKIASVLRHIRVTPGLDVEYNTFLGTYRLSDSYIRRTPRKAVAGD